MKFTAALLALAAAVAAPLASAQCTGTNLLTIGNLTVASTIKRTSVKGGARIMQTITVKNNNAATTSIKLETPFNTDNELIKGRAKAPGSPTVTLSGTTSPVTSGTTELKIPSGKTLKATIAYRAKRCPSPSPKDYLFGPAVASLTSDNTCTKASSATPTTVRSRANTK